MKKNRVFSLIVIVLVLAILSCIYYFNNKNFIKINYSEILEKIDNKETFILCVTASDCVHCNEYKPKLKKISNKYDIIIYYTNIDDMTDGEYDDFKENISFDGGTPVTIFFKEGKEATTATRIEGNVSSEKIIDKMKKNDFLNN